MKFIAKTLFYVAISILLIFWICNMLGIGEETVLKWGNSFKNYIINTFS